MSINFRKLDKLESITVVTKSNVFNSDSNGPYE